jgi:malate dehydrogenase
MTTVAIIGAGDLGGAAAQALAARDRVARILLVDTAHDLAAGKALDIQQSGAVDRFHTQLTATDDFTAVTAARLCIVADRAGPPRAEWEGEDALAMLARALPYMSDVPIVFAGTQQADTILRAAAELAVRRQRLIGSASHALTSAIRSIVALEAGCSPSEVVLAVLGTPPEGFVVAWSEASVGGNPLDRVLTPPQIRRIEMRAARLWPPGPHALGTAAARVAEAIVTSSRQSVSVLTVLGGEFGIRGRVGVLPVHLSPRGIAHVRMPSLTTRERVQLETALGG